MIDLILIGDKKKRTKVMTIFFMLQKHHLMVKYSIQSMLLL